MLISVEGGLVLTYHSFGKNFSAYVGGMQPGYIGVVVHEPVGLVGTILGE